MKKCGFCGKPIYTENDYCNTCNMKYKDNIEVFHRIKDEWKLEAKKEDSKYFYYFDDANEILAGNKSLVIGRKGEGKTAIAQYIYSQSNYNVFTEKMSFKSFPFNKLYGTIDNKFTRPNQYISIWKFLIYSTICKQMIKNQNISLAVSNDLKMIFPESDNTKRLSKLIEEYTVNGFGIHCINFGLNLSLQKQEKITWLDLIDVLERLILEKIDDSKYYILFDELDEDYKDFASKQEETDYFDLITGLLKAVQDARTLFEDNKLNIYPIVFLRSDIYNRITYSDKNKWSDSVIWLTWTPEKLQKLLNHRLNIVLETKGHSFQECWTTLFGKQSMYYGTRKSKKIGAFGYILRSTQNRPRDFIKYFQVCSNFAIKSNDICISSKIIKLADGEFSEYLKNEIGDEIYAVLPEFQNIFAILSLIRKQTFKPHEFVEKYKFMVNDGQIPDRGAEKVLTTLFDFSVIGNNPSIKNQAIFKYERDAARFNFKENIIVHRGLYKALQIF